MRIVAGAWRGRTLVAPSGQGTRPTADRVRQALFDMIMHAEWGGRGVMEGAVVLDVFAGTGALGLEALSRGAASVCFIEWDAAALRALRTNVAACRAEDRVEVLAGDALAVRPPIPALRVAGREHTYPGDAGGGASLVFLDPPYGRDLVPQAVAHLHEVGRIAPRALVVAEIGREATWTPAGLLLAEREHGAARIIIFRGN